MVGTSRPLLSCSVSHSSEGAGEPTVLAAEAMDSPASEPVGSLIRPLSGSAEPSGCTWHTRVSSGLDSTHS